jgi:hypothetical protein
MTTEPTYLERFSERVATGLAKRVPRETFLGRFGQTMIAVSLGGAGAAYLTTDALAHVPSSCGPGSAGLCTGSCCSANSVTCLTGYGQNSCPSGSYTCGYWEFTDSSCSTFNHIRRWTDCCGGCNNGANCRCFGSNPSCCRHKDYAQQTTNYCDHIKCRFTFCH